MTKRQAKRFINQKKKDGLVLSQHDFITVQSAWMKKFGRGELYYIDLTENNMLEDLAE